MSVTLNVVKEGTPLAMLREPSCANIFDKLVLELRHAGLCEDVAEAIEKNPLVRDALVITNFQNRREVVRLIARIDATVGDYSQIRDENFYDQFTEKLRNLSSLYLSELEAIRRVMFSELECLFCHNSTEQLNREGMRVPPEHLFHWTSHSKYKEMVEYNPSKNQVPLRFLGKRHAVTKTFPELNGRSGIFAWSDPVSGMMNHSGTEVYALSEKDHPPVLIVMKPRKNARVLEIISQLGPIEQANRFVIPPKTIPGINKVDLFFHKVIDQSNSRLWSEWIVVNPEAIESFSADPQHSAPLLRRELKKLEDPDSVYPEDSLFIPKQPMNREKRIEILYKFLPKSSDENRSVSSLEEHLTAEKPFPERRNEL